MTAKDMFSHRVSILTGHDGTGKTEVSVNLALALAAEGEQVMLADLDIVNPYFRSRERRPLLEKAGVRVISSSQACPSPGFWISAAIRWAPGCWPGFSPRSYRRITS